MNKQHLKTLTTNNSNEKKKLYECNIMIYRFVQRPVAGVYPSAAHRKKKTYAMKSAELQETTLYEYFMAHIVFLV